MGGRDRVTDAMECANRCVAEAFAQTNMKDAAVLLRAAARYLERELDAGNGRLGEVVAFPTPVCRSGPYWGSQTFG